MELPRAIYDQLVKELGVEETHRRMEQTGFTVKVTDDEVEQMAQVMNTLTGKLGIDREYAVTAVQHFGLGKMMELVNVLTGQPAGAEDKALNNNPVLTARLVGIMGHMGANAADAQSLIDQHGLSKLLGVIESLTTKAAQAPSMVETITGERSSHIEFAAQARLSADRKVRGELSLVEMLTGEKGGE